MAVKRIKEIAAMAGFFEFVPLSFLENLCFYIEDVGDILNLQEAVPAIAIAIDKLFWDRQHSLVLGSRDQRIEWRALQTIDQHSYTIPCAVETFVKIVSKARNIKKFRMHRNSGFDEREELLIIDAILKSDIQLSSITLKFWNFQYLHYRNDRNFYWPTKTISQYLTELVSKNRDTLRYLSVGLLQSFQLEFWKYFEVNGLEIRLDSTGNCDSQTFALVFYPFLQAFTLQSITPHRVRLNVKCAQRDRAKCALQRAYQSALNNFTHRLHLENLEINIDDMAAVEMEDVAELMGSMSTYLFSMPELGMISWEFSHLQFDLMEMRSYFESLRTQKGLYFDRVIMESNKKIRYERKRQPEVKSDCISNLLNCSQPIKCI